MSFLFVMMVPPGGAQTIFPRLFWAQLPLANALVEGKSITILNKRRRLHISTTLFVTLNKLQAVFAERRIYRHTTSRIIENLRLV
jgi:hypothetical protein